MLVIARRDESGTSYLTPAGEWQAEPGKALAFFEVAEALKHARTVGGTHVLNTRVGNTLTV